MKHSRKLDNNCLNGSTPPTLNNSGTIESTYTGNCFSDSNTSQSCKCGSIHVSLPAMSFCLTIKSTYDFKVSVK
ncbi:hypothetical protein MPTK1_3g23290 [Marchantia polymorpha subsp. ruderalis]|uniref:Uncharacterized protein n=2 Tax=Marchantia polymorpha TaxID=3197 RepID=A0AAF6B3X0_MARPO|nr:hypothetical protein MARPO_3457s0001 [Marchantia polymorpha]BBN06704.1 hypothetical protein Mp_3g23290 [Marchantia polymorpha subsp. ruderalis]|eukprot:PTQ26281.1 hypothetical protein MARPO_3457s0001 [Marchantia polymorpha]